MLSRLFGIFIIAIVVGWVVWTAFEIIVNLFK